MKPIIKHIHHVILLNCITLLSLSAESHMLKFNELDPEQQNIHAFLCRQAVFGNYKDTTNRFSVAISFVFENGARKTFLIKTPDKNAYFESVNLDTVLREKRKILLENNIINDASNLSKELQHYIEIKQKEAKTKDYDQQRTYDSAHRLGDSEVSFLYAMNNLRLVKNFDENFQKQCIQSLAEKITHKLARIELHGFTTRDMCPCCYSYMNCFLKQSNEIKLKSETTNNADPKDKEGINRSSNKDVFDSKKISEQPDNESKNGNANLINSNGFKNFFERLLEQENVKKYISEDKQIPINFFISSLVELSGEAYNCSVYRGYENTKEKLPDAKEIDKNGNNLYCILLRKEGSKNLSQEKIKIDNNDCFILNMGNKPCYLGNWKTWKGHQKVLGESNRKLTCGYYDHDNNNIVWSRISSDGVSVKASLPLDAIPNIPADEWMFKEAKTMYNANHIFVKKPKASLNGTFYTYLNIYPKRINNESQEKPIHKIESGCVKTQWYEALKVFLKEKQSIDEKFSILNREYKREIIKKDELESSLKAFSLSGETILKNLADYLGDSELTIQLWKHSPEKCTKNFLIVFNKDDTSPAIFKRKEDMDLEDLDEQNSLFLYYDGKEYYKITPKTESEDAPKTDANKEDPKEESEEPFKTSPFEKSSSMAKAKNE